MNKEQAEKQKKVGRVILYIAPAVAFAPAIIGGIGSSVIPNCNESNCYFGALPWATFLTFPLGIVIAIVGLIVTVTAKPSNK
jgi:hypothetical protein